MIAQAGHELCLEGKNAETCSDIRGTSRIALNSKPSGRVIGIVPYVRDVAGSRRVRGTG